MNEIADDRDMEICFLGNIRQPTALEDRKNGFGYDYEKDMIRSCEKCGRPYRPGATFCDHCVDKRVYLKRIWEIAKPFRFYIYINYYSI